MEIDRKTPLKQYYDIPLYVRKCRVYKLQGVMEPTPSEVRLMNILQKKPERTIKELLELTTADLRRIIGMGDATIAVLYEVLRKSSERHRDVFLFQITETGPEDPMERIKRRYQKKLELIYKQQKAPTDASQ